ncbi:polysaccharide deacetylase family protein [Arthrobacter sp. UKPF54-2]|uniref:polysaccharide deacetylase family protein n=1 Tax=Arthrobacter sp. UKPF54-2 TaxID=2600159 RepID=UPI0011B19181|nr:polysaccharide deacetylase family protein [Arthrobacter sp. UKPF54-2]QDY89484.1 polysaccharide deacetylase family protein [Arthrobacter sp. UKPF54-2]
MWSILAGNRRRMVALAAAVLLLAAAVVTALFLAGRPRGAPPASGSPSAAATPSGTPSATPAPPSGTTTGPPSSPTVTEAPATEAPPPPAEPPPAEPPPPPPPADPFPAALRGADVGLIPNAGPVVALTFDAGANSAGLPSILQTLATTGVRATFFLTGNWASANPAGVASIVAAGHRVGNHSMTHPGFTSLSDAQIAQQLAGAEAAIAAAGAEARPLFRFPFGERDARTIAAVNALGYLPVRWSVDTLGWKGTSGGITAQTVADRALAALQPGEIVLMHIGSNPDDASTLDADALPQLITRIRQAGYGFTTLDALLG